MKSNKNCLLFLTTVFLGLLLYPAGYAFSQNHESEVVLNFGNLLLVNENYLKNGKISQHGFLNHMFIWPLEDTLKYNVSKFEGLQIGILNQAIIYSQQNATPFNTKIDQQGVRNRLTIFQAAGEQSISKSDSSVSKNNSVTIMQNGNSNSATVIQN
jgi:hypothetical protein